MKKLNEAQKLLMKLGAPCFSPPKRRSKSYTKKGPGRVHNYSGEKRK